MKKKVIPEITPYEINGSECGRDKNGKFVCLCGKCKPLPQISHNGNNRRNQCNRRNHDTPIHIITTL